MTDHPIITEYVTSADGTRIGYLQQGSGPGIALVQGAMADAHAYSRLAGELSDASTVLSIDRRGRGLSPQPYSEDHDNPRDVEDIDAVLQATGAATVFGLSSGAVIALEATRTLPRIERAILFEPPFYRNGIDHDGVTRLGREIRDDDLASALIDSLLVAGTAPTVIRLAPRPVARVLAALVIALDARRRPGSSFRDLLPGVRYDFHDVSQLDGHLQQFKKVDKPVLLLSGTRSPAFLQQAVDDLAHHRPRAEQRRLAGLGHDGPWNSGAPKPVAAAIHQFLERQQPSPR